MTPERYNQISRVFDTACRLSGAERTAYLDQACAVDKELRAEVEDLLAHDEKSLPIEPIIPAAAILDSGLSRPSDGPSGFGSPAAQILPSRVGRFRILRKIGEGGMGVVYEAEQDNPRRTVALKVIRPGVASHQVLLRFGIEAQILGRLQHSGIAQIYEAGTAAIETAAGLAVEQPYFAMEYVHGEPLDQAVPKPGTDTRARLEVFVKICDAVQHAHQKGVIHRDLKPGNILIDQSGQPKILDFGVARLTDSDLQVTTLHTDMGQLIGTIPYMSPEQIAGDPRELDTRSDVYALGVLCYQLLTGKLPHDLRGKAIAEAARTVTEEVPARISSIDRRLRGDLETIVGKAMEKEKDRRYQSASDLATDVRHFLAGEPISARPQTTFYQIRMFARRNRALVGGIAATALALLAGITGTALQAVRATHARNDAVEAKQLAESRRHIAEVRAYAANIAAAQAALRGHDVATAHQHLEAAPLALRHWEWGLLAASADASLTTWPEHRAKVWGVAFSPDGRYLASAGHDGFVRIHDTASGGEVRRLSVEGVLFRDIAVSPDGALIASCTDTKKVMLWDAETGARRATLEGHQGCVNRVAFSPDGRFLASASIDGTARLWEVATGQQARMLTHPTWVFSVSFSRDGTHLATSCRDNVVRVWDLATDAAPLEIAVVPATGDWDYVHSWPVVFAPDRPVLATGRHDGLIQMWDASNGTSLQVLVGHSERVRSLAFSPDGQRLVSASDDCTLRFWNTGSAAETVTLQGHRGAIQAVCFSPDSSRIATGSDDGTAKLWDSTASPGFTLNCSCGNRGISALAVSSDGTRIVGGCEDGRVRVWDAVSGAGLFALTGHRNAVTAVATGPCAELAASGSRDRTVRLWDITAGKEIAVLGPHQEPVHAVTFFQNGTHLMSASRDGAVVLWDIATRSKLQTVSGAAPPYTAAACRPDGAQLAVGTQSGKIEFWNIPNQRWCSSADAHREAVSYLAYSPDGAYLVSASHDHSLKLWDALTHQELRVIKGHTDWVEAIAFSPDTARIASVSRDRSLKLWDAHTGQSLLSLGPYPDYVFGVAFSPDGTWLATSAKSVQVWEAFHPDEQVLRKRRARSAAESLLDRLAGELRTNGDLLARIEADNEVPPEIRECAFQIARFRSLNEPDQ